MRFQVKNKLLKIDCSCKGIFLLALFVGSSFFPQQTKAQIRSGSAFLKILPGVRHQGLAGSYTGVIDELHALFANPAATGFLREWQWSAAYTEWIADTYNLSWIYGRQVRTPWSKQTRFALGIHYQGVRDFNSTNDPTQISVNANDALFTASIGNPLNILTKNISMGANIKYLRSELSNFTASSWIFDVGLLYRSNRYKINLGKFEYLILSAGLAVTQLGSSLKFISNDTPLPRTVRAGVTLNIGSHKDWQIQLTGDYQKVRDEVDQGSIGVEIARSYRYAGRIGYNFNSNQLSKLTFGFSLDLDGILPFKKKVLAGRNNAVRADFAYLEDNDFFAPPLRFGVNRYPILPEKFDLLNPTLAVKQADEPVSLSWQATHDPDLYDNVTYALYWAKEDSAGVAELKKARDKMHLDALVSKNPQITSIDPIRPENSNSETLNITLTPPEKCDEITFWNGGNYYWTTVAYDEDNHIRFANQVGKFHLELPDIEITKIEFTPHPWITESDTQGVINVFVRNNSKTPVKNIVVTTIDSKPVEYTGKGLDVTKADTIWQHIHSNVPSEAQAPIQVDWGTAVLGWKDSIEKLDPGQVDSIEFDWRISDHGKHQFIANAQILCKPNQQLPESDLANNNTTAYFYTIPKGTIKTEKEIIVLEETVYEFELPFIRKVFFEHGSAAVPSLRKSHNNSLLDTLVKKFENQFTFSPLDTLAKRLVSHPDIYLNLKGSVDLADGESSSLAHERAEAVKNYLQSHGIDGNRVRIDRTDVIFDKNPRPTRDLTKVQEERRFVKVFAYDASQNNQETSVLFHSIQLTMPKSTSFSKVPFISTIHGAVPPDTARVYLKPENTFSTHTTLDSSLLVKYPTMSADTTIFWEHYKNKKVKWLDKAVEYSLGLKDTLGRKFFTHKNTVVLLSQIRNPIVIVGVADFREEKIDSTGTPWSDIRRQLQKRVKPWSDIMGKLLKQESQPVEPTTTQTKESNRPQERIITKISANAKKTIIKRLKENKIGTIRIVGHACDIGGAAINKELSKKRAENFKNDFLTGLKEDPELAHLIENIKIETEGKGESESFCVDVDSTSFMQALNIPQEFELIQKQVNDRLRRDKTFPFTFELFHDRKTHKAMIKIKSDNETPIGRQINRRIEIHFEPIKQPQVLTENKYSTANKAL